jgi:hypothetical protein
MDHVKYVCKVVVDALKDDTLKGLSGNKKEILIISFYEAQVGFYDRELDQRARIGVLTPRQRKQIEVCTVDTAQDMERDLVIVDFVQTRHPGTTCDRRRLCVALTGARQASSPTSNTRSKSCPMARTRVSSRPSIRTLRHTTGLSGWMLPRRGGIRVWRER